MRQSYLKNAALLTGSDVVLRLAGMGLRIWLANELGGEGMGLYQLVLAVYSLFITLATAGVSVAATRLDGAMVFTLIIMVIILLVLIPVGIVVDKKIEAYFENKREP